MDGHQELQLPRSSLVGKQAWWEIPTKGWRRRIAVFGFVLLGLILGSSWFSLIAHLATGKLEVWNNILWLVFDLAGLAVALILLSAFWVYILIRNIAAR